MSRESKILEHNELCTLRMNHLEELVGRALLKITRLERANRNLKCALARIRQVEPATPTDEGETSEKTIKCRRSLICFQCSGKGHFASECVVKNSSQESTKKRMVCRTCGGWDHFQRNCPSSKFGPKCFGCGGTGHNFRECINRANERMRQRYQCCETLTPDQATDEGGSVSMN